MELFEQGDRVRRVAGGEKGVVLAFDEHLGYQVAFGSGIEYLGELAIELLPLEPHEALLRGDLSTAELYGLRVRALYLQHAYRYDELAGLSSARIEPAFHQVMVALQVLSKNRPRMILADEVGLGKTIEAGLILKELRARRMVDRVLIVVPASLQWQWQHELRSKFNEDFEILDGPMIRSLGKRGGNPWSRHDNVICSLSLARAKRHSERVVEAGWDIVVFDEAHRVRRRRHGARTHSTLGYQLADELKSTVDGMLLLTATPMQLHPYELYSLIDLVEPGICDSFAEYEAERRALPQLVEMARDIQQWNLLTEESRRGLESSFSEHVLDLSTEDGRDSALALLDMRHPFARTMIRNRKGDIGGFTQRRPKLVLVDLEPTEMKLYQDVSRYIRKQYNLARQTNHRAIGFLMVTYQKMLASSSNAVRGALQRRISKLTEHRESASADTLSGLRVEDWRDPRELSAAVEGTEHGTVESIPAKIDTEIGILKDMVRRLGKVRDSKARQLLITLHGEIPPGDKVIIFTQFLETQAFLKKLLEYHGHDVEIFNGRMDQRKKDKSVARFRGRSDILIATEAGGEGRNFQFAHTMINYDLPWNPMKIEQRIGRLDRIGQKQDVIVYNFACKDTIEERILDVLAKRIHLFEESVGSLDPILGDLEEDIKGLVFDDQHDTGSRLEELGCDIELRVEQARKLENERRYLALDPAIFRQNQASRLVEERAMAGPSELQSYVEDAVRSYGGRLVEHPDGGVGIYLSRELQRRLGAKESSYRGVFDHREAMEREDLEYFALGQDLVDSVIDLAVDLPSTTACYRGSAGVGEGPFVEIFYAIEAEGPVRFGQFVHHLIGEDLRVEECEVTAMPDIGTAARCDVPAWFDRAMEVSKAKLSARRAVVATEVDELHSQWSEEELDRTKRFYKDRQRRLDQRIVDDIARIERLENTGTSKEQRILPAIRGRLDKNRRRLASLDEERSHRITEVRARKSSVSTRILAAALVVGG